MEANDKPSGNAPALLAYSVVGAYALFGGLWIVLSDRLLDRLVTDRALNLAMQTYKGWFYVAVTAVLLYLLIRMALENLRRLEEEKLRAERELMQSQKMELVGRLASGVAHDFNNILTAIMGLAQMSALSLPKGDQHRADMEDILKFAESAGAITAQLLAFSRKQIPQPLPLDIGVLARDTAKMLRRVAGEAVELEYNLRENLWPVRVDPLHLQQVLMNLIVNARDAMPAGGKVTVGAENVSLAAPMPARGGEIPAGDHVLLTVRDEGRGIAAELLDKVFEPFFTTKEPGKGTGLGLSVVRSIVEQTGGRIDVVSRKNEGADFRIYLPRYVGAEKCGLCAEKGSPPLGGSETVLLVDDQADILPVLRRMLESEGYNVLCARNYSEAMGLLKAGNKRIDLLVTDSIMPGKTGADLAAAVKELQPDSMVLYISGMADSAEVRDRVIARGEPFLPKPFTQEALLTKVRETLGRPG